MTTIVAPELSDQMRNAIVDWQKKLLQLDRRNNLLYLKLGRSSVSIDGLEPQELVEALSRTRKGLTFDYIPPGSLRRKPTINAPNPEGKEDRPNLR